MSGICRTGPAGAEVAAVSPRKRAFAAFGPPKTDRCSREGQNPQQTPKKTLQIRGSLGDNAPKIADGIMEAAFPLTCSQAREEGAFWYRQDQSALDAECIDHAVLRPRCG